MGGEASGAPGWLALLYLVAALALRCSTFGNPNVEADDQFYALVGQRMHDGLLPYVDMWDRKPLGLFAIYYLIAGISRSAVAYQITATLFAAATAWVVYAITAGMMATGGADPAQAAPRRGAVLAGLAYLLLLGPFAGAGGQAPVFYNLFVALAAWLVWRAGPVLARGGVPAGVWGAMALAGLAISVKETALFEAGFLGLWVLWCLQRGGMRGGALVAHAVGFALVGAAPLLATALPYLITHHWPEYWQAMVTSNLIKSQVLKNYRYSTTFILGSALRMVPLLPLALAGLMLGWRAMRGSAPLVFLVGWLVAAVLGYLSLWNFAPHYLLPLLVPLCVAAGLVFARAEGGTLAFAATACAALFWYNPTDRAWNLHAIASTAALAEAVERHDHGRGLLVFEGPVSLYTLTNRPFLSPLVFPHHLNFALERNVSHLDTDAEVDRILARRPGAVVMTLAPLSLPANIYAWVRVRAYVRGCGPCLWHDALSSP